MKEELGYAMNQFYLFKNKGEKEMKKAMVDIESIVDSIFQELSDREKYDLLEELLRNYGGTEMCKEVFRTDLLAEFSEEDVVQYFDLDINKGE